MRICFSTGYEDDAYGLAWLALRAPKHVRLRYDTFWFGAMKFVSVCIGVVWKGSMGPLFVTYYSAETYLLLMM